jgi:hypothetical protein
MTQQDSAYIESLRDELGLIYAHAIVFFSDIADTTVKNSQHLPWEKDGQQHWETADWRQLTTAQQDVAQKIRKRLADCGARLIDAVRKSALLEQPDEVEVKRMLRGMADHVGTGTMNSVMGSGAPLNWGFNITGEPDKSAPQDLESVSGM